MGEMIAQNASNKDSRSLNEPRDVGRRKRIGHSPPTNIPATSLGSPQGRWRLDFWKSFRAKVGPLAGGVRGIKNEQKVPTLNTLNHRLRDGLMGEDANEAIGH